MTVPEIQIDFINKCMDAKIDVIVLTWVDNHVRMKLRRCDGRIGYVAFHEMCVDRPAASGYADACIKHMTESWKRSKENPTYTVQA